MPEDTVSVMKVSTLIEQLKSMEDQTQELVVAYWDADWFKQMVCVDGKFVTEEEIDECMYATESVLEYGGLSDMIVDSCSHAVTIRRKNEESSLSSWWRVQEKPKKKARKKKSEKKKSVEKKSKKKSKKKEKK